MRDKLQGLMGGLQSPNWSIPKQAIGQYKSLVMGNQRGAALGLAFAASYGMLTGSHDPVESTVVLGPIFAGVGAAIQAGGGFGAFKGIGGKANEALSLIMKAPADWRGPGAAAFQAEFAAAAATNPLTKGITGLMPGGHPEYLLRSKPVTHSQNIMNRIAQLEGDPIPMGWRYAAAAADAYTSPGKEPIETIGEMARSGRLDQLIKTYGDADNLISRVGSDPVFAEQFAKRMGDFKGVTGFDVRGAEVISKKAFHLGYPGNNAIGKQLVVQGNVELAEEVMKLPGDVRVKAIFIGGTADNMIGALEFELDKHIWRTPVVGKDGIIKAGLMSRNVNIAERQVFLGSLQSVFQGGAPEVLPLDVNVVRTLREFRGRPGLAQYLSKLSNMPIHGLKRGKGVATETGSAFTWTSPYRADRASQSMTSNNAILRAMNVGVALPDEGLMRSMGLEDFVNRGALTDDMVLNMRNAGLINFTSERSAQKNKYQFIEDMRELSPGATITPTDKPSSFYRDNSKPYWVASDRPAHRAPLMTTQRMRRLGSDPGMAIHYNVLLDSEVAFLSKVLNKSSKASVKHQMMAAKEANDMINEVMGRKLNAREMSNMMQALDPIAKMREGQFVAAFGGDAMMVGGRSPIMYGVPDDIANLKPGSILPSNRAFGYTEDLLPVYDSFHRFGGGQSILTSIERIDDNGRVAHQMIWEEMQNADDVKWGSAVGKMKALKQKKAHTPLVQEFINNLRSHPTLGPKMTANQPYAPLMAGKIGSTRNVIEAFTLPGAVTKLQGAHETFFSAINEIWKPQMSSAGQAKVRALFSQNRVRVSPMTDGLIVNWKNRQQSEKAFNASKKFLEDMVSDPKSFGLAPETFSNLVEGGSINKITQAIMSGGVTVEGKPWAATNRDIPKRVPLTEGQFAFMREYGMHEGAKDLWMRRGLTGNAEATQAYKLALEAFSKPNTAIKSNMPVVNINDWFDETVSAGEWRNSSRAKHNFLINLEMTSDTLDAGSLKKILGINTLHIPVPGADTDFWLESYRASTGSLTSSEKWTEPLARLLKNVKGIYGGQDLEAATKARSALAEYVNKIRRTDADLSIGRKGRVYDTGEALAGFLVHKDYTQEYIGHPKLGGRASQFIIGVSPKRYAELGGGTSEYMPGWFVRQPVSTTDPTFLVSDTDLEYGQMAVGEERRALSGGDYDADTGTFSKAKRPAAIQEIEDIVMGGTPKAANWDEALQTRALLGGVEDDLAALLRASNKGQSGFSRIADKMTKRFASLVGVEDELAEVLLSKGYTRSIGRFTNLANEFVMASTVMGSTGQTSRTQLLMMIKQVAIDFARHSGKGDPERQAQALEASVKRAAAGDIDGANRSFRTIFEKFKIGENIEQNLNLLKTAYADDPKKVALLERLAKATQASIAGFYEPLRDSPGLQTEFQAMFEAQKLFQKKQYGGQAIPGSVDEVSEAFTGLEAHLQAQADLAPRGVASIGRGSAGASGDRLTLWNKAKSGMRGANHIRGDLWKIAKASPHYGTVKGGAIATLGLMVATALFKSPTEMKQPSYMGQQRNMMQSPDIGLAGMSGAPMPGLGLGHVVRGGEIRNPRRIEAPPIIQNMIPHRFYVNQTNRVPRVRYNTSGDPTNQNAIAAEISSAMQRMAGGSARINVVHDVTSRRINELEIQDQMRNDMRGGR